jgi:hypothetical protein
MGSPVDAPVLENLLYAKKGGIAYATLNLDFAGLSA